MTLWTDLTGVPFSLDVVDANGVRTRALRAGSGPDAVFLHGTSGHLEAFSRNIAAHVDAGIRCHAIDMLGMMQQLGVVPAPPPAEPIPAPHLTGAPSTREANHALMRRFIEEVWNKGNVAVADEIFHRVRRVLQRVVDLVHPAFLDGAGLLADRQHGVAEAVELGLGLRFRRLDHQRAGDRPA